MAELGFHYLSEGEADALPVVFLHAFPYHGAMWDEQRAAVSSRARFIAMDFRGFGPNWSRPQQAYTLEHLVDDLIALLDHLQIPAAVLCGLSLGGYVALRAIERNPERVKGLLLADTQAAADSNQAKFARADGVRGLVRDGVDPFIDTSLKRTLSPHTLEQRPEVLTRLRTMISESDKSAMIAGLVALASRSDTTDSLARIGVPTTVVVGEHDLITAPHVAQLLASRITGATLQVLEDAGHISNVEAPQAFNRVLLTLLDRVQATAKAGSR